MSESKAEFRIHSKHLVHPSPPPAGGEPRRRQIHLNPWSLRMLSIDYIQKGILFLLPTVNHPNHLLSSFTQALTLFYPFAGRLTTVLHPTSPPSLSIHLDCNDAGAEFIHASASHLTASDFTSSVFINPAIRSLFPLAGVVSHKGHSIPLLAVQVTDLADGSLFLACSLNHAVADGASFWNFFKTWSTLCRSGGAGDVTPPVVDQWFLPSTPPPILLPFSDESEFIHRDPLPPARECFLPFSRRAVARLKVKANEEMGVKTISSLQALLAHLWRAATRARKLEPHVETAYVVIVGHRNRVAPPLPDNYMGNTAVGFRATARAWELAEKGLGWAAWRLNQAVASVTEETTRRWVEEWAKKPELMRTRDLNGTVLVTGSSPRFDVFGNDFGWGSPAAVRSGDGNKVDGKATVYQGEGSMALEVCLSPAALCALVEDDEFMEPVGQ